VPLARCSSAPERVGRLENGKLVGHWDLLPPLPSDLSSIPHDNGFFCPGSPCSIR
jgi:hypothetical protein